MNFRYISNILAFIFWPGGLAWAAVMFDRLQTPGASAGVSDYLLDVALPLAIAIGAGALRLAVLLKNAVTPPANRNGSLIAKLAANYAIAGDPKGLDLIKELAVMEKVR